MKTAWQGEMEFLGATWNDRDGRSAALRLIGTPGDDSEHPFKHFTRSRGGRGGTRFQLSMSKVGTEEATMCEVMLIDWMENAGGRSVRFWVDPEPDRHPFEGLMRANGGTPGDKLMVAIIEVNDQDEVVEESERTKHHGQRLSNYAALLCREERFRDWMWQTAITKRKTERSEWTEALAAEYIRKVCGISSRSELDRNEIAAAKFHRSIRVPYSLYCQHGTRHDMQG